jgi:hypothetical protein
VNTATNGAPSTTPPGDFPPVISGSKPLPDAELPAPAEESPEPRRFLWQGKVGPAFWTVASILSLVVNLILIVILLLLASQLFQIKKLVGVQLVGGLYNNFVRMDEASIVTTIMVSDTIRVEDTMPVVFNLPLKQETEVVLTKDTYINKATVFLNNTAVPTDIILRQGTRLNILLDINVPVNQTIPVVLNVPVQLEVPVNIPLNQTELHQPFVGLQEVVSPYKTLMDKLPNSWSDILCGPLPDWMCK